MDWKSDPCGLVERVQVCKLQCHRDHQVCGKTGRSPESLGQGLDPGTDERTKNKAEEPLEAPSSWGLTWKVVMGPQGGISGTLASRPGQALKTG